MIMHLSGKTCRRFSTCVEPIILLVRPRLCRVRSSVLDMVVTQNHVAIFFCDTLAWGSASYHASSIGTSLVRLYARRTHRQRQRESKRPSKQPTDQLLALSAAQTIFHCGAVVRILSNAERMLCFPLGVVRGHEAMYIGAAVELQMTDG